MTSRRPKKRGGKVLRAHSPRNRKLTKQPRKHLCFSKKKHSDKAREEPNGHTVAIPPSSLDAPEYVAQDALTRYLQDISKTPLLTPKEEVALAKRIRRGDNAARDHMIRANLRLVVRIAREYEGLGLPFLDVISEGNTGLMKAVDRYNHRKGAKLSTYASLWIRQRIRRALSNQSRIIRLPVHLSAKLGLVSKAALRLTDELGREPSNDEIADEMNVSRVLMRRWVKAPTRPVWIDAPLTSEKDAGSLAETLPDYRAQTASSHLDENERIKMIGTFLAQLPEREARILAMRFGLNNEHERTLEDIGNIFGITRERVRQIQNGLLNDLRWYIKRIESQGNSLVQINWNGEIRMK